MLSTLAVRKGGIHVLRSLKGGFGGVPVRGCAVVPSGERKLEPYESDYPKSFPEPVPLETKIAHWDRANEIFYGPDRDLKNFPHPKFQVEPEKYQLGLIPTRWFQALYPKLGVTGGYTLFWGSILFAFNKELIVTEHIFGEAYVYVAVVTGLTIMFGPKLGAAIDKYIAKSRREMYEEPLENAKSSYNAGIEESKTEIWRQDAVPSIFEAKEEFVDLQLETQYRQRLEEVHRTVKQRLDYQVDLENTQRQFEQDHMVNWIVDGVKKSITPQQEKESIASCIQTLKRLSAQPAV